MITDTGSAVRAREVLPAYLRLGVQEIGRRADEALAALHSCRACPRNCGIDRLRDETAVCKSGRYARVSSSFSHFGEEDCLRGWKGSGTIFFSWCNLRCVFCLHPDTFVATDRGVLPVGELFQQGADEVQARDGRISFFHGKLGVATRTGSWAPLAKVFRHHFRGDLVVIKPFNCPPLRLTPNHDVFVIPKVGSGEVIKVPADRLARGDYLWVPKRAPRHAPVELDVGALLSASARSVRAPRGRRHSPAELDRLFSQPLTSGKLAELTGYHPAYIRKLRGQWRRGLLLHDPAPKTDGVVEEGGLVRFGSERRPGIPSRLPVDERLAWLLGIYCAEGHSTSQKGRPNSHRLIFSFGRRETGLVERTHRLLRDLFGVRASVRERRTTVTVEVGKASLALLFAHLCGKRAREKQVPAPLGGAAPDVVKAFLRGVVDGDGCDRGTHVVINSISERLAVGLFEIGILLGVLPSFHRWDGAPKTTIEGREVNQAPLYYVKFPKADPRSGKQHSRWRERGDHFLIPIHRVSRVPYDGPVFNLEVDDLDHSYVASFVAVGNCQNWDVSQLGEGSVVSPERLAAMMLELQARGCHNINFVTPEHVVPQILEALPRAIRGGLRLPIVYNTSAYDSLESLRWMEDVVDIYMPDFKVWGEGAAKRYLKAPGYPEAARVAIREMHRQVGVLAMDEDGLARRGVLVRHLVMPGMLDETRQIMTWLARELSPDTYVNVMAQYHPAGTVSTERYPEINRQLLPAEYEAGVRVAREAGLWRLDERRPRARSLWG